MLRRGGRARPPALRPRRRADDAGTGAGAALFSLGRGIFHRVEGPARGRGNPVRGPARPDAPGTLAACGRSYSASSRIITGRIPRPGDAACPAAGTVSRRTARVVRGGGRRLPLRGTRSRCPALRPRGRNSTRRTAAELLALYARRALRAARPGRRRSRNFRRPCQPVGCSICCSRRANWSRPRRDSASPARRGRAPRETARNVAGERGSVTLSGLRDALETSRRYAQALLERMDADGFTRREGDAHLLRE